MRAGWRWVKRGWKWGAWVIVSTINQNFKKEIVHKEEMPVPSRDHRGKLASNHTGLRCMKKQTMSNPRF